MAIKIVMIAFAVITGVAQQAPEAVTATGLTHRRTEFGVVGPGAAVDNDGQTQVRIDMDDCGKLGKTAIFAARTLAEAGRHMAGFQTGGVDGRQFAVAIDQALAAGERHRGVEQGLERLFLAAARRLSGWR